MLFKERIKHPTVGLGDEASVEVEASIFDWGPFTTNQNRLRASRDVCGIAHIKKEVKI